MGVDIEQKLFPNGLERMALVVKGDTLVVAGNNAGTYDGTWLATIELLKRLGCRWRDLHQR